MNTRRLVTALCFALVCSALLTWQLSKHLSPTTTPPHALPLRATVIAARDIPTGEPITSSSISVMNWPASQQLAGSFTTAQDLIGRTLVVPVSAGELILTHDLALPGSGTSVTAAVPIGMRAISVHVSDESAGVSGLLASGSHVDVFVSYRSDIEAAFVSSMVLQNVRVLATAKKGTPEPATRAHADDSITLLVTPEEAARFTAGSSLGKLTFAVRNETDSALTPGLSHVSLSNGSALRPEAPLLPAARSSSFSKRATKTGFTMETLSGGKATVQTFQGEQP